MLIVCTYWPRILNHLYMNDYIMISMINLFCYYFLLSKSFIPELNKVISSNFSFFLCSYFKKTKSITTLLINTAEVGRVSSPSCEIPTTPFKNKTIDEYCKNMSDYQGC